MSAIKKFLYLVFCGLLLGSLLVSCNLPATLPAWLIPPTETPLPIPAATATTVQSPTPTVQIIEILIETEPAPTKTVFAPTETITPTTPPTELQQNGPWMVFSAVDGMWVINPDGSSLTQLSPDIPPDSRPLQIGSAPDGANLAYITARKEWYDLTLKLVTLPGGTPQTITSLTSIDTEPKTGIGSAKDLPETIRALLLEDILAWSPGGTHLAFVGAMQGTSTDLYLYSVKDRQITQMTKGATQVLHPVWSPAGTYILYLGVRSLGDEKGYVQMDVWSVRSDTGEVKWLYKPEKSGWEVILGWVDDTNFLVYSWNPDGLSNLRRMDIVTLKAEVLWEGKFNSAAYDPKSQKVMMVLSPPEVPIEDQGILLLGTTGGNRTFIFIENASTAAWIPEAGLFTTSTPNGVVMLSPDGSYFRLPVSELGQLIAAPDGNRLGWFGAGGVLIGEIKRLNQNPPTQVYKSPVMSAAWAPDSETVFFFSLAGLYMIQPPYDNPILLEPGIASQNLAWVKP